MSIENNKLQNGGDVRVIPADTASRSICVIVPAFNAALHLKRVLKPLMEMLEASDVQEVIVVDDCSHDTTAKIAREIGANILTTPQNGGPSVARNLAAKSTDKSILWFVDADVIVWPDGAGKIRAAFSEPGVKAVFGSYDEAQDGTPWFSRYKNLTHRFYHQNARREASTFWAGCGAVDAELFRDIGGFDVENACPRSRISSLGIASGNQAGGSFLPLICLVIT